MTENPAASRMAASSSHRDFDPEQFLKPELCGSCRNLLNWLAFPTGTATQHKNSSRDYGKRSNSPRATEISRASTMVSDNQTVSEGRSSEGGNEGSSFAHNQYLSGGSTEKSQNDITSKSQSDRKVPLRESRKISDGHNKKAYKKGSAKSKSKKEPGGKHVRRSKSVSPERTSNRRATHRSASEQSSRPTPSKVPRVMMLNKKFARSALASIPGMAGAPMNGKMFGLVVVYGKSRGEDQHKGKGKPGGRKKEKEVKKKSDGSGKDKKAKEVKGKARKEDKARAKHKPSNQRKEKEKKKKSHTKIGDERKKHHVENDHEIRVECPPKGTLPSHDECEGNCEKVTTSTASCDANRPGIEERSDLIRHGNEARSDDQRHRSSKEHTLCKVHISGKEPGKVPSLVVKVCAKTSKSSK